MNRLLRRQLRRYNIDIEDIPEDFKKLLTDINNSYLHFDFCVSGDGKCTKGPNRAARVDPEVRA